MAPIRATRKRKSNQSTSSIEDQKIPTMKGSPSRSPIKKRKLGLSLAQKQALIDNLQLEITERARRLRAQYNIQAQQLRSRVEMRVNRIPTALRKAKMGELLSKSLQPPQPRHPPKSTYVARPPPVPAKDGTSPKPIPRKPVPTSSAAAGRKRLSEEISGADKENQGNAVENPKKRPRGVPTKEPTHIQPAQVLSPTSSNTRILPRERPASPTKSMISRPASPMKGPTKASSNILSSMVEKAKGTRATAATRKATASSTASSNTGTAATRTRQAAAIPRPPTAASTRGRRKLSATSESSNGSTATVVKKTAATRPASRAAKTTAPAPPAKRTVMSSIRSAASKKPPASKATTTTSTTTGTGRTLRKRNQT
ncbi:Borealin N terminal-domain-containing protein [Hypomontagnella monticulosa]|nr:Borealin N terminal-domain-containing protein [Hypomontagnella monticulosa]